MRILVITPTFFPIMGGAERGIFDIFIRLAAKHEVRILAPFPEKKILVDFGRDDPYEIGRANVHYFHDRINLLGLPGYWKLRGFVIPLSLSTAYAGFKIVNSFRPDIIICFYPLRTGLAGLLLKKFKRVPVILALVGREVPGPEIPRSWKNYAVFFLRKAGKAIFLSNFCRRALGLEESFGQVIPFGVDTKIFRPGLDGTSIRARFNIPEKAKILFSIQRLDRWKRVDILIKAMKTILDQVDAYLLVGGKGPEINTLIRLAKDLAIDSKVIFTGYIKDEDLPLFYAMADVFIFHSTYETLGLVLLEAMASGKPIVSVRSTAIPEVVENNVNGILVEPLNPEEIAKAALLLLKDPAKREKFGQASREIVLKRFDLDVIVEKYERALQGYKTQD